MIATFLIQGVYNIGICTTDIAIRNVSTFRLAFRLPNRVADLKLIVTQSLGRRGL